MCGGQPREGERRSSAGKGDQAREGEALKRCAGVRRGKGKRDQALGKAIRRGKGKNDQSREGKKRSVAGRLNTAAICGGQPREDRTLQQYAGTNRGKRESAELEIERGKIERCSDMRGPAAGR